MKTICLATNNPHKVTELKKMLGDTFDIKTLADIGCTEDVEETEDTFQGNSRLKATYVHENYNIDCISDDSGLEVEALNGEPGVFSARYAGEHGNHAKNMDLLLENLKGQSNRKAQFRTVVTLILNGEEKQFEGIVKGQITKEKRGEEGFGYDPIFLPDGYGRTFAEMSLEVKNPISHRGQAVQKMIAFLNSI